MQCYSAVVPSVMLTPVLRPEKDHPAQLRALYELFQAHPEYRETVRLILIGGSRNAEDAARVELLRALAVKLGINVTSFAAMDGWRR